MERIRADVPMNITEFSSTTKAAGMKAPWRGFVTLLTGLILLGTDCVSNAAATADLLASETPGPIVHEFTPATGPAGTEVTITGENFANATSVTFGQVSATFRAGISDTSLIAIVPAGATTGRIAVTTLAGTFTTLDLFTVTSTPPPVIGTFSPESGPVGTRVLINGSGFIGVSEVRFGGIPAEFSLLGEAISAGVPQGASTGPITIVAAGGSASSPTLFTVTIVGAPVITSINPAAGQPSTTVTLSGENLDSAISVSFNGIPAVFSVFGPAIFATVPDNAASGPITVVTSKGTAVSPVPFTVIGGLAPVITSFTPETGEPGAIVTVTGTNLLNVTEVLLGGAAAEFTITSSEELKATVPAGATTGPITVTAPSGSAVSPTLFYLPAAIVSFDPNRGPAGTVVRIQGRNLAESIAVLFGGVSASFTVVSPAEVMATVPEGAVSGAISIATPAGFAHSTGNFLLPPRITSFDPVSGPVGGGVTINGDNLLGATSVRFGGVEATFTPLSTSSLVATTPASAVNGPITVVTPAGTATSASPFYVGLFGNLGVGLEASPESVSVGDFLRYSVTVTNRGPLEAGNVVVTDRLPAGAALLFPPSGANCVVANGLITCQLGALPPGGGAQIRFTVTVAAGPYLTNQVDVTSSIADPDPSDNSGSLVTALAGTPEPDVFLAARMVGETLELSWPSPSTGYILERASGLAAVTLWQVVPTAPAVLNGRKTVLIPISSGRSFYRLAKPE